MTTIGESAAVVLAGCLEDDTDEVTTYLLVYVDDDGRTEVETPEDEAIMYPALDAGVDIPYSCEVGRCGKCTARYDGDANDVVEHDRNEYLDDDRIADGWVLTCVAYARDDFDSRWHTRTTSDPMGRAGPYRPFSGTTGVVVGAAVTRPVLDVDISDVAE